MQKLFTVPAGGSIVLQCRDPYAYGNLIILSSYFVINNYRSMAVVMSGNGNGTNAGQTVSINVLVESPLISYANVTDNGDYNTVTITNSSTTYQAYIRAITLYGRAPSQIS